jgi:NAD(P)-dependent dehydrogenase (short-subunit alcohol dehydrogenase family)
MQIKFEANTVALVTGASKGIGLACARQLAQCGARVAIVARNEETLAEAKASLSETGADIQTFTADLSNPQAANAMVEQVESQMGPISVLVTSAGAAKRFAPDELSPDAFEQGMQAKYFPGVLVMDPVIKRMAERGNGSIVNIIGQGGRQAGVFHIAGGAANSALMLATVGYARAYADKGIRINGINPGLTETSRVTEGLQTESRATGKSIDELREQAQASIPMKRMAKPEEVAQVAAFLASDMASYVSGAIVPMDGCSASVI